MATPPAVLARTSLGSTSDHTKTPRAPISVASSVLDGNVIPLPHECRDAIATRAAENIKAATEHLTANA